MNKENSKILLREGYVNFRPNSRENNNNNNNNNNETFPIEWFEIKDSVSQDTLLMIPFSSLVKVDTYLRAIHKQPIFLQNSASEIITQAIKQLYTNNEIIFSPAFLKQIFQCSDTNTIEIKVKYVLSEAGPFTFTASHLYFLTFLYREGPFVLKSEEKNTLHFTSDKENILEKIPVWRHSHYQEKPNPRI